MKLTMASSMKIPVMADGGGQTDNPTRRLLIKLELADDKTDDVTCDVTLRHASLEAGGTRTSSSGLDLLDSLFDDDLDDEERTEEYLLPDDDSDIQPKNEVKPESGVARAGLLLCSESAENSFNHVADSVSSVCLNTPGVCSHGFSSSSSTPAPQSEPLNMHQKTKQKSPHRTPVSVKQEMHTQTISTQISTDGNQTPGHMRCVDVKAENTTRSRASLPSALSVNSLIDEVERELDHIVTGMHWENTTSESMDDCVAERQSIATQTDTPNTGNIKADDPELPQYSLTPKEDVQKMTSRNPNLTNTEKHSIKYIVEEDDITIIAESSPTNEMSTRKEDDYLDCASSIILRQDKLQVILRKVNLQEDDLPDLSIKEFRAAMLPLTGAEELILKKHRRYLMNERSKERCRKQPYTVERAEQDNHLLHKCIFAIQNELQLQSIPVPKFSSPSNTDDFNAESAEAEFDVFTSTNADDREAMGLLERVGITKGKLPLSTTKELQQRMTSYSKAEMDILKAFRRRLRCRMTSKKRRLQQLSPLEKICRQNKKLEEHFYKMHVSLQSSKSDLSPAYEMAVTDYRQLERKHIKQRITLESSDKQPRNPPTQQPTKSVHVKTKVIPEIIEIEDSEDDDADLNLLKEEQQETRPPGTPPSPSMPQLVPIDKLKDSVTPADNLTQNAPKQIEISGTTPRDAHQPTSDKKITKEKSSTDHDEQPQDLRMKRIKTHHDPKRTIPSAAEEGPLDLSRKPSIAGKYEDNKEMAKVENEGSSFNAQQSRNAPEQITQVLKPSELVLKHSETASCETLKATGPHADTGHDINKLAETVIDSTSTIVPTTTATTGSLNDVKLPTQITSTLDAQFKPNIQINTNASSYNLVEATPGKKSKTRRPKLTGTHLNNKFPLVSNQATISNSPIFPSVVTSSANIQQPRPIVSAYGLAQQAQQTTSITTTQGQARPGLQVPKILFVSSTSQPAIEEKTLTKIGNPIQPQHQLQNQHLNQPMPPTLIGQPMHFNQPGNHQQLRHPVPGVPNNIIYHQPVTQFIPPQPYQTQQHNVQTNNPSCMYPPNNHITGQPQHITLTPNYPASADTGSNHELHESVNSGMHELRHQQNITPIKQTQQQMQQQQPQQNNNAPNQQNLFYQQPPIQVFANQSNLQPAYTPETRSPGTFQPYFDGNELRQHKAITPHTNLQHPQMVMLPCSGQVPQTAYSQWNQQRQIPVSVNHAIRHKILTKVNQVRYDTHMPNNFRQYAENTHFPVVQNHSNLKVQYSDNANTAHPPATNIGMEPLTMKPLPQHLEAQKPNIMIQSPSQYSVSSTGETTLQKAGTALMTESKVQESTLSSLKTVNEPMQCLTGNNMADSGGQERDRTSMSSVVRQNNLKDAPVLTSMLCQATDNNQPSDSNAFVASTSITKFRGVTRSTVETADNPTMVDETSKARHNQNTDPREAGRKQSLVNDCIRVKPDHNGETTLVPLKPTSEDELSQAKRHHSAEAATVGQEPSLEGETGRARHNLKIDARVVSLVAPNQRSAAIGSTSPGHHSPKHEHIRQETIGTDVSSTTPVTMLDKLSRKRPRSIEQTSGDFPSLKHNKTAEPEEESDDDQPLTIALGGEHAQQFHGSALQGKMAPKSSMIKSKNILVDKVKASKKETGQSKNTSEDKIQTKGTREVKAPNKVTGKSKITVKDYMKRKAHQQIEENIFLKSLDVENRANDWRITSNTTDNPYADNCHAGNKKLKLHFCKYSTSKQNRQDHQPSKSPVKAQNNATDVQYRHKIFKPTPMQHYASQS